VLTVYLLSVLAATMLIPLAVAPGLDSNTSIPILMTFPSLLAFFGGLMLANPIRLSPMVWPVLFLAGTRMASLVISQPASPIAGIYTLAALAGPAAFVAARARPAGIPGALRALGLAVAGLAMAQALLGFQDAFMNRNVVAGLLVVSLLACLPEIRRDRPISALSALLVASALLLTGSRGGIIAGALATALYCGVLKRALPLVALATPALIQIRNPRTLAIRWEYWLDAIGAWRSAPLLGIGPQHFPGGAAHAHNLWLDVLAWSGVVGVVVLAGGIWLSRPAWPELPRWARCALVGFLAHSLVDDLTVFPLAVVAVAAVMAAQATLVLAGASPLLTVRSPSSPAAMDDRSSPALAMGAGNHRHP